MKIVASIESLYSDGYASITMLPKHKRKLRECMDALTWVPEKDGMYSNIPLQTAHLNRSSENAEIDYSNFGMDIFPQEILESLRFFILEQHVFGMLENMYHFEINFLDIWDGAEDTGWHWDGPEYSDFIFIIYLANNTYWKEEWGGSIQIGVREIEEIDNWMNVDENTSVKLLETVLPTNGSVVIVNNQNPKFVHKVYPLVEEKERKVVTFGVSLNRKSKSDDVSKVIFKQRKKV